VDYWSANDATRARLRAGFGMLFQSAALWSSMTILENVCLPLEQHTQLDARQREARAREVLAWVDLAEFAGFYPSDLSGGMKKRAGLARALAAEPPLLFLDEPSAGLDPISSKRLDDLILALRERTGAAVVFVSHELPSLFAIADDGIFLDADSKQPIAHGAPRALRDSAQHPTVRAFLRREEPPQTGAGTQATGTAESTPTLPHSAPTPAPVP
ncbi:MAG: ATP-binding cassette domain-containing protein, partial [Burkholderiaceae bacterium]